MPILETEFLFALREGDRFHSQALQILSRYEELQLADLKVSTTGFLEVANVLRGRNFKSERIAQVLGEMRRKMNLHDLQEVKLDAEIIEKCEELISKKELNLTYFDALHAAAAALYDRTIISNDNIFDKLGIRRISFKDFVQKPL